jgi:CTP:molybdopterin cytidylyltransferase MocA
MSKEKDNSKGVIILSGGYSSRMNYPKAYLIYKEKTFLETIVESYVNIGFKNIIVVMNNDFCSNEWNSFLKPIRQHATIIVNNHPERGRLYSLKLAASEMKDVDYCFIQNVDNPFIEEKTIFMLWINRNEKGYATPVFKGKGGHPVLVSKAVIKHILSLVNNEKTLKEALKGFDKRTVETDDKRILININTMDDYEKYIQNKLEAIS